MPHVIPTLVETTWVTSETYTRALGKMESSGLYGWNNIIYTNSSIIFCVYKVLLYFKLT